MRYKGHVTFKYRLWACALALIGAACAVASPAPSPSPPPSPPVPPAATASAVPGPLPTAGLVVPVVGVTLDRAWYTTPDPVFHGSPVATADFASDPSATAPRIRLDPGARDIALSPGAVPTRWTATIDLGALGPGRYGLEVVERIAGVDVLVPGKSTPGALFTLSAPEYVVWTLDFEGDVASDDTMANAAAIADALKAPMTIMWNPRAWTTTAVSAAQADAMLAWTRGRAAKGDEVALHLHMWTDYVRAAGVAVRLSPSWSGRGDGYDVPMTAYSEDEQGKLIAFGLELMSDHGLAGVASFRAGGDFGDAATLRAIAANGLTADCTAVPAGTFGSLRWPWTLAPDAQPYRPSREDANAPGDLPLLEAPTNGGNTYGYSSLSIAPIVRADLAMLAKAGDAATGRKALTIVSHPGTIDQTERAAIETLLRSFDPLRYDQDRGPLRFVTLRQLAQAWR